MELSIKCVCLNSTSRHPSILEKPRVRFVFQCTLQKDVCTTHTVAKTTVCFFRVLPWAIATISHCPSTTPPQQRLGSARHDLGLPGRDPATQPHKLAGQYQEKNPSCKRWRLSQKWLLIFEDRWHVRDFSETPSHGTLIHWKKPVLKLDSSHSDCFSS